MILGPSTLWRVFGPQGPGLVLGTSGLCENWPGAYEECINRKFIVRTNFNRFRVKTQGDVVFGNLFHTLWSGAGVGANSAKITF